MLLYRYVLYHDVLNIGQSGCSIQSEVCLLNQLVFLYDSFGLTVFLHLLYQLAEVGISRECDRYYRRVKQINI